MLQRQFLSELAFSSNGKESVMDKNARVVKVVNLTKRYRSTLAVNGLSFHIEPGEIFGLIGANGAGKTTTIAILLGLVTPTDGEITIFGLDPKRHRRKVLERMNFSSPYISLPHRLTVLQNLTVYADLYGVRNIRSRLDDLCGKLGISDLLKRHFGQLSSGQKTRVAIAKALINEPDLLLLDEPTASLDPDVAERVRSCLLSYREEKGAAILVSSHNMQEVERICDRMLILKQGKKMIEGTPASIISRYRTKDLESVFIEIARGEDN